MQICIKIKIFYKFISRSKYKSFKIKNIKKLLHNLHKPIYLKVIQGPVMVTMCKHAVHG